MKAKEYLGQAYRIDHRINSKIEQVSSLNSLALKATTTLSDMPTSGSRNVQRMEEIIVKIVDMESDINNDIDVLVDLKKEISKIIQKISNLEYQTLLELRYLCFRTWEEIAINMGYSIQHTYRVNNDALKAVDKILKDESKC
ncbi:MAG: DUF1492 domain-containing protein [Anaerotignum sp.]